MIDKSQNSRIQCGGYRSLGRGVPAEQYSAHNDNWREKRQEPALERMKKLLPGKFRHHAVIAPFGDKPGYDHLINTDHNTRQNTRYKHLADGYACHACENQHIVLGGITGPMTAEQAVTAAEKGLGYPFSTISGIRITLVVAASAEAEPDMPAITVLLRILTCARPPRNCRRRPAPDP